MTVSQRPNIVIMYADDLGFGDIGCYGAANIPTPNLDRLAAGGIRFSDAHATAATCTPSRYSLLTGAYPWREQRAKILAGDAALIIEPGSPTMPALLRQAGYRTSVIGKWHLGLGDGDIDWNGHIAPGPLEVGFDRCYMMAATNDRVPCVYVDNHGIDGLHPDDPITTCYDQNAPPLPRELPRGTEHPEMLRQQWSHDHNDAIVNGVSRIGRMGGGTTALWTDETMAEVFLTKAKQEVSAAVDAQQPFFLYYAFHQPHVPRLPAPRFQGVTGLGPRGDVIAEMDYCIGEFLDHLEATGQREHTIVIFSSDNGPVLDDGYHDRAAELNGDHKPAGPLRGGKYSLFDGGTRVPTILSWPAAVTPGESDELICQVDFLASFAALVGVALPEGSAPDSLNVLDALLGRGPSLREEMLVEGIWNSDVLRQGNLVCIPPHPYEGWFQHKTGTESGRQESAQLYDLAADISQIRDLAAEQPAIVERMLARIAAIHTQPGTR